MTHPALPPTPPSRPGDGAVCVRHPDRVTGLSCTRCGRPSCPECLRAAAVGAQCVDCVAQGGREVRRATTVAGAEPLERAIVVPVLIALNVAVFVWTAVQAGSVSNNADSDLFDAWALAPFLVADGDWWRLVTSGFLHIGPIHLLFNMWALWVLGRDLEKVLGRGRFTALYAVSLLGGAASVMLFSNPATATAGASGAVFGLMGGLAIVLRRLNAPVGQVIGLIAVNLVISVVVPNISIAGHLGGLVVGAAATAALVYAPVRNRLRVQAVALVGITIVVLAAIVLAIST